VTPATLPAVTATCYRYRELGASQWRTASASGIQSGPAAALSADALPLDFDSAIDLAHRYREEADLAADRGDEAADEQWSLWAEELEIWAAKRRPPPGIIRRTAVYACDQHPTFAEMTRR
jgi:hypothetical protein